MTEEKHVVVVAIPRQQDVDDIASLGYVDPSEVHCTVVYMGDLDDEKIEEVRISLRETASDLAPFKAMGGATEEFGDEALVLRVEEVPALKELRSQFEHLNASDKEYKPHVTLGYEVKPEDLNGPPPLELEFDRLGLWVGEDHDDHQLGQVSVVAALTYQATPRELVAAVVGLQPDSKWNSKLHPRGHDGKFIKVGGFVRWLENLEWKTGKVKSIDPTSGEIHVVGDDLNTHKFSNGSKLYSQPTPKAKLSVGIMPSPAMTMGDDDGFFKKIGGQGGSNPGGLFEVISDDPELSDEQLKKGDKFYAKKQKSGSHGLNEALASNLYELAGVPVPEVKSTAGGGKTMSAIVEGTTLGSLPPAERKLAIAKLREDMVIDAWLANWDVAGMGMDNVVVDKDGVPWRIDVGGSILYRAQGGPKGANFGTKVGELTSLKNSSMNPVSAKVFADVTPEELEAGGQRLAAITPDQIKTAVQDAGLEDSVADTLIARRADALKQLGIVPPSEKKYEPPLPYLDAILPPEASASLEDFKLDPGAEGAASGNPIVMPTGYVLEEYDTVEDEFGTEWSVVSPVPNEDGNITVSNTIADDDFQVVLAETVATKWTVAGDPKAVAAKAAATGTPAAPTLTGQYVALKIKPGGDSSAYQFAMIADVVGPNAEGKYTYSEWNPHVGANVPAIGDLDEYDMYVVNSSDASGLYEEYKSAAGNDSSVGDLVGDFFTDAAPTPAAPVQMKDFGGFVYNVVGENDDAWLVELAGGDGAPTYITKSLLTPVTVDDIDDSAGGSSDDEEAAVVELDPDALPPVHGERIEGNEYTPGTKIFKGPSFEPIEGDWQANTDLGKKANMAAIEGLALDLQKAIDNGSPRLYYTKHGSTHRALVVTSTEWVQDGEYKYLKLSGTDLAGNAESHSLSSWMMPPFYSMEPGQASTSNPPKATMKKDGSVVVNGVAIGSWTKNYNSFAATINPSHSPTGQTLQINYGAKGEIAGMVPKFAIVPPPGPKVKAPSTVAPFKAAAEATPSADGTKKMSDGYEASVGTMVKHKKKGFVGEVVGYPPKHPDYVYVVEKPMGSTSTVGLKKKIVSLNQLEIETPPAPEPPPYLGPKTKDGSVPKIGQTVTSAKGVTGVITKAYPKTGYLKIKTADGKETTITVGASVVVTDVDASLPPAFPSPDIDETSTVTPPAAPSAPTAAPAPTVAPEAGKPTGYGAPLAGTASSAPTLPRPRGVPSLEAENVPTVTVPEPTGAKPDYSATPFAGESVSAALWNVVGSHKGPNSGVSGAMFDSTAVYDQKVRFQEVVGADGKKYIEARVVLMQDHADDVGSKLLNGSTSNKVGGWVAGDAIPATSLSPGNTVKIRVGSQGGNGPKVWKPDPSIGSPNAVIESVSPPWADSAGQQYVNAKVKLMDGSFVYVDYQVRPEGINTYDWDPNAVMPSPSGYKLGSDAVKAGWGREPGIGVASVSLNANGEKIYKNPFGAKPGQALGFGDASHQHTLSRTLGDGTNVQFTYVDQGAGGVGYKQPRSATINNEVLIRVPASNNSAQMEAALAAGMESLGISAEMQAPPSVADVQQLSISKLAGSLHINTKAAKQATGAPDDPATQAVLKAAGEKLGLGRDMTLDDMSIYTDDDGKSWVGFSDGIAAHISKKQGGSWYRHGVSGGGSVLIKMLSDAVGTGLLPTEERFSRGIMTTGQSSVSDMANGAGHGIYVSGANNHNGKLGSNGVFIPARAVNRKMSVYANSGDGWGKWSSTKWWETSSPYEYIVKDGVQADEIGYIKVSSNDKVAIMKALKQKGITHIGGRPVDDVVRTESPTAAKAKAFFDDFKLTPGVPVGSLTDASNLAGVS